MYRQEFKEKIKFLKRKGREKKGYGVKVKERVGEIYYYYYYFFLVEDVDLVELNTNRLPVLGGLQSSILNKP
jgi:hypothetical protein